MKETPCNTCGGLSVSVPAGWRTCTIEVDDVGQQYFAVVALGEIGSINSRPSDGAAPRIRPTSPTIAEMDLPAENQRDEHEEAVDADMEDVDGDDNSHIHGDPGSDDDSVLGRHAPSSIPAISRGADQLRRSRGPPRHSQTPLADVRETALANLPERPAGVLGQQRAVEPAHVCPEPAVQGKSPQNLYESASLTRFIVSEHELSSNDFFDYLHGRRSQGYRFPDAYRFQKTIRPENGVLVTSRRRPPGPEIKDEASIHVPELEDGEISSQRKRRRVAERPRGGIGSSVNTAIDLD